MEGSKKQTNTYLKNYWLTQTVYFIQLKKLTKRFFLNKARKSFYEKRKVFYKLYARIEDQNIFDDDKVKVPIYNPFLEQKKDINHSSAFYSIKGPFKLVHVDIANIRGFFNVCSQSKLLFTMCWSFFTKSLCLPNEKKKFFSKKSWNFL